ncbi:MAG: flagellar biosynthetic protein FliQ [Deltaproteobacteria bacterium]|nr:flagellar biosynthetic protein FliQ [Deltaproteobacteria bacterium]
MLELSHVTAQTLYLVLIVSSPVLVVSLLVGTIIGIFQAATQVHEHTVSFVPKLFAIALVLLVSGGWMSGQLVTFTAALWQSIPKLVH